MLKENKRIQGLLVKSNSTTSDLERLSMFYIFSGNDDLYNKVNFLYNFDENVIIADCLENCHQDFSGSSKSLIRLAFNLFNGYPGDINEIFQSLDSQNANLAINAIKLRYGIE